MVLYRRKIREVQERGSRSSFSEEDIRLESCICFMLERYIDDIPPIECDRFHKSFRQNDVVDNDAPEGCGGKMDMVIWNLLNCHCTIFWKMQGDWAEAVAAIEEAPSDQA